MVDGIVILTLTRPQAANALSVSLFKEIKETLVDIKYDSSIKSVIVTGQGEKAFCAGADLKERADMDEEQAKRTVSLIKEVINSFEALPKPVIAAINGVALGGGLELAMACDIRIAADSAKLGLTETSLAIIPGAGGTQRLSRLIGKGKAKELIFTARKIDAIEAEKIGLTEYAVPIDQLLDKAFEIAAQIAKNGPIAITQAKFAIDKGYEVDLATGLEIEEKAYEIIIPTKDRLEGLAAFKEKRPPIYKGH